MPVTPPYYWWLFSVAMTFWGLATVPVVFYIYRHFAPISRWAAIIGALLLLVGCAGIILVGVIPTGHSDVIDGFNWGRAPRRAGLLTAFAFGIGAFRLDLAVFGFKGLHLAALFLERGGGRFGGGADDIAHGGGGQRSQRRGGKGQRDQKRTGHGRNLSIRSVRVSVEPAMQGVSHPGCRLSEPHLRAPSICRAFISPALSAG